MAFQVGGLASGLDTQTMIEQLMQLERRPITALERRKSALSRSNSAFQALNTRLSSLQSKLTDLLLEKNLKAKSTASSDATVMTATAGAGAAASSYRVKVNQLATATTASSAGAGATAATGALTLANAKPANTTAITTGTFTIGGATVTINSTSATLQKVVDAINGAGSANVSVSGTSGLGAGGASLTAAGQIQLDVTGVTAAVGGGADTSNFLTIAGLKSPSRTTSGVNTYLVGGRMSTAQTTAKLNDSGANGANLTTAVTGDGSGNGSFKINGVSVSYNIATDTLNDVLGRINNSTAGVSASYNSIEDKIVLTNKSTGSTAISLEDVTGNFLAATRLSTGTQTMGQNAQIVVDGVNSNNPLESSTNEFKDIIPSLTFTAKKVETASWTSITVSKDTDTTINTVKSFLNEFNATIDALEAARAKGQPLASDSAVTDIVGKLRRLVQDPVSGLSDSPNTLSALGIGTTSTDRKHLSLDETKFKEWLDKNPDRLVEIFNKDSTADTPTGVAARLKDYLADLRSSEGVFTSRSNSFTRQSKQIDEQIRSYETRLEQRRRLLVGQFTSMEKAVGLMKSQQSAMLSQLGSLQQ